MTKEQVIEQLKSLKADRESFIQNDKEHDKFFLDDIEAIETVLSILEEQDKIIDLMSEKIYQEGIVWDNKEEVKQYFEDKAKELLNK
jgi:hypothetical protein